MSDEVRDPYAWTRDGPREDGYYFFRATPDRDWESVRVYAHDPPPRVSWIGYRRSHRSLPH